MTKNVMIIGKNTTNQQLLEKFINNLGYGSIRCDSVDDIEEILKENLMISLALVDISDFGVDLARQLKILHAGVTTIVIFKQKSSIHHPSFNEIIQSAIVLEKPVRMNQLAAIVKEVVEQSIQQEAKK